MPIYEYECKSCSNHFERLQRMSDPMPSICPKCGSDVIHRIMSVPFLQFKGKGFYITDYPKKGSSEKSPGKNK